MHHLATLQHHDGPIDLYRATSAADGPEFWPLMGPWFASKTVADTLGEGVYDHPDLVWTLAVQSGRAIGFGAVDLRRLDRGDALLNYAYVDESARGDGLYARLLEARIDFVRTATPARRLLALCTAASAPTLAAHGFTETSKRGRYTRFALEIPR